MPGALPLKRQKMAASDSVFLNVPYDPAFSPQFLAYICGICCLALSLESLWKSKAEFDAWIGS